MKRRLLTILITLTTGCVYAQDLLPLDRIKSEHAYLVQGILNGQQPKAALRPTTIRQRMIAFVRTQPFGFLITDSIAYTYSGAHGSAYPHNTLGIYMPTGFNPSYAPMVNNPRGTYSDMLQADHIRVFTNGEEIHREVATYNTDDKLDSVMRWNLPAPGPITRLNTSYNNDGLLEELTYTDLSTGDPASLERWKYVYNNDRQVADTSFIPNDDDWTMAFYSIYTYTDEGHLALTRIYEATTPESPSMSIELLHNSDGFVSVVNWYSGDVAPEYLLAIDSIAYLAGSSLFHEFKEYTFENGDMYGYAITRNFGSNGLPDTNIHTSYTAVGGWEQQQVVTISYNDFDNPEHFNVYVPDVEDPVMEIQLYYETYDDGVGIGIPNKATALMLYPNPFLDEVYFDFPESGQQFTATVYNIVGQQVYARRIQSTSGKQTLNLSELGPGNYLLQVVDGKGNVYRSQMTKH